jgi:hypothetical protein
LLGSPVHTGVEISPTSSKYDIRNNILCGIQSSDHSSYIHTNNIYTGYSWNQESRYNWALGTGEIYQTDSTQVFVDPANADYRLKTGSPAINAGIMPPLDSLKINGYPDIDFSADIIGNARGAGGAWDMGAYEYVAIGVRSADRGARTEKTEMVYSNPMKAVDGRQLVREGKIDAFFRLTGKKSDLMETIENGIYMVKTRDGMRAIVILK